MKKIFFTLFLGLFLFSCTEQKNINSNSGTEKVKTKNQVQKCDSKDQTSQCQKNIFFSGKLEKISKLGLFIDEAKNISLNNGIGFDEQKVNYYKVGEFDLDAKKGEIILAENTEVHAKAKFYFTLFNGKYYFIDELNQYTSGENVENGRNFLSEKVEKEKNQKINDLLIPELKIEEKVEFEKNGKKYSLKLRENLTIEFDEKNLEKINELDEKGEFFIEKNEEHSWLSDWARDISEKEKKDYEYVEKNLNREEKEKYYEEIYKKSLFSNKGIYKKLADGTTAVYSLVIPFERIPTEQENKNGEIQNIFDLNLKDYNGKITNYYTEDSSGCGVSLYSLVLNGKFEIIKDTPKLSETLNLSYKNEDLTEIGTTKDGDKIYYFKDKNHKFLKGFYEAYVGNFNENLDTEEKGKIKPQTYEEFTKDFIILFWDDPFGRRLAFIKHGADHNFENACGAKPVIYLYPKQKQEISVSLNWKKKNLISIPKYEGIWEVKANPNGEIEFNGKNYPYLFWEDTLNFRKKEDGFVVTKDNLSKFFDEKLNILGLNEKEIQDFKEFWLEKMKDFPFYFIRFYGNEEMDFSAPISIKPEPDSIQRVFMDYKGLHKKIFVKEQILKSFNRKGFSVIEWGGNLQEK
ncbi:hypothetical protein D8B46_00515 [Candidatus Gracilibacteria bacterium]|nr:MAG: hypothetical protein D8B46_00515 [Candidatus Gracilibacteria bacterium]